MDCCRCIAAGRGASLLTSACLRLLLLLLAGACGGAAAMIMLQAAAAVDVLLGWVAVGLSCGQLSLRELHDC